MSTAGGGDPEAAKRSSDTAARSPVICFAGQDWWYHNRAHSDFQLMTRAARTRSVLLVNSIGMRMPLPGRTSRPFRRIGRKLRSMAKFLRRPIPELSTFRVFTPVSFPLYGAPWARAFNGWLVRSQVRLVAWLLDIRDPILFVTLPTAWDVVRTMPRRSLVFNRSDKASEFPEADRASIAALEDQLLQNADVVVYVSRALMEEERGVVGARGHFLDHGVDLDRFDSAKQTSEPLDLQAIPRPRVGFFGTLREHLVDFDLLERLSRELPNVQLVLVGDATSAMDRFAELRNVHWLGFRPYEDIPRYGARFDVAIMPWRDNEWIRNCNPIKLKEYLALGLPVVSSDFPEVRRYASVVRIARDPQEFIHLVATSLEDKGLESAALRRASVQEASWDARTEQLLRLVEARY